MRRNTGTIQAPHQKMSGASNLLPAKAARKVSGEYRLADVLDTVEFREEVGPGWDADNRHTAGPQKFRQGRDRTTVIVQMFDDIEGEQGVVEFPAFRWRLV